ncbi:hypothetical protein SAMN05428984_2861 [Sphingomonas sp. OK281]|nr:hypothetical protein SAMN05428984_2861 [Sphingomonas sp. OK281]
MMNEYQRALTLLTEAADLMDSIGDTLIAAHISTPMALVEDRLHPLNGTTDLDRSPGG